MASSKKQTDGRSPLLNPQRQITSFFTKATSFPQCPTQKNPNSNPNHKPKNNGSPSPSPNTPYPTQSKPVKPLPVISQSQLYGKEVVEKRVRVYWSLDKRWYEGVVRSYDEFSGRHWVEYDDCEKELDLGKAKIQWVEESGGSNVVVDDEEMEDKSNDLDYSSDEDWRGNAEKEESEEEALEDGDSEEEKGKKEKNGLVRKGIASGGVKSGSAKKSKVELNVGNNVTKVSAVEPAKNVERRKLKYPVKKPSWLFLLKHEEAYRYIPQQGDELIYLRQGHEEFIVSTSTKEKGPWNSIKGLRATEVCKVESLVYSTAPAGYSCCKLTLRFIDPSSKAYEKTFKFTLPELIYFPDFFVEKTRYDDAVSRSWAPNDKCLVWWRNENGEDGSWWDGKIEFLQAKVAEFPDSPWERYNLSYDTDPPEYHEHSPWELHDPDVPWKHPCLYPEIREELLSSFSKLERSVKNQDYYGIQKFNEASQKLDFVNRFPVPLYPEIIQVRLENDYYRSFEAVKHDIQVMMENAKSYFKNADLSRRIKRLSEWYTKKLPELEEF